MAQPAIKTWTTDDFLALAARPESEKCELFEGALVAMAQVWLSLKRAIEAAHSPCQAFVDGLSVVIDEQTAFVPDALVNCGEPVAPDSLVAPSPVIVVEVLSPSTRGIDKSRKVFEYFRVPSLAHYLVVDIESKGALHYRRGAATKASCDIVREGAITFDPPGLSVALADFFD